MTHAAALADRGLARAMVQVDGQAVEVEAGTSVAAAVERARPGHGARLAPGGERRLPLCGMGVCGECRVTIDGRAHRLGCQTICVPGMDIRTDGAPPAAAAREPDHPPGEAGELSADVVVVGAGPGGLAAARAAARGGASVLVVDANPAPGGQVWRARRGLARDEVARRLGELQSAGVRLLPQARAVMALPGDALLLEQPQGARVLRWRRLVLATGARERLLPFPGWTLPGVFGAGGLQALVKGGWPIAGQRVVVAGTGPLGLAAAATLRAEGARIVGWIEEAAPPALLRLAGAMLRHPAKGLEAARLLRRLAGVRFRAGTRLQAAEGRGRVERVRLEGPDGPSTLACDALAAGFGLVPQVELAQMLGCVLAPRFGAPAVAVGARQHTSRAGVFAIGECTGVAGARAALLAGELAGATAAAELGDEPLPGAGRALAREQRFARSLARAFPVPTGWRARLASDTLVCRCEDVRWDELRDRPDLRSAKLATRCGMGHCQGRLCHDALVHLTGASRLPARPPVTPIELGALLAICPAGGAGPESFPVPPEESPR